MNRQLLRSCLAACLVQAAIAITPAAAQEPAAATTREAELAREQAEKATRVQPMGANKAEQIVLRIQDSGLLGGAPRGLYPWAGSVLGGGGMAGGVGYRSRLPKGSSVHVLGGWSIENYKLLESGLQVPLAGDGRVALDIDARWIDAPAVNFFGIGNDADETALSTYLYRPARTGATVAVAVTNWFSLGGGGDYLDVTTGPGDGENPIDAAFTPATVPGLGQNAGYGVARVFAAIDTRPSPDYNRRGGLYRVDGATYAGQNEASTDFHTVAIDLRQFIPLQRENWVVALHAESVLTFSNDDQPLPYLMLPYLGSGSTLRGYATRRFIDRNSLLMQGELRWMPSRFVDMAVFYDAGRVAAAPGDLGFSDLHTDAGIGIRFHGPRFSVFRLDVAKGDEGLRLVWATDLF